MYGGGDALNHKQKLEISSHNHPPLDYLFQSAPSNSFLGSRSMVSFGALGGVDKSGSSFFLQDENGDEYLDEYFENQPDKKRRLSVDQVQFLERSFETENKLEPDRKVKLAKELGLQPRQIAIWFQNRRARWKTKQLETEYETLNSSYESLKENYDNLLKENEKLKIEVVNLKSKVLGVACKNEEQSSAKSDVTDVESPRLADGIHSSLVFELDKSDLLRNGEDNLNEELLQPGYIFANTEDGNNIHPPASSCYYGFQVEDPAFSFWSN
ncbi:hypothetical protein RD792_006014 [Penstemon davidsonii]|uniref:Homeobox-leucine zipper protein n=1 Tax=Penstemon davidsonii TaxID=160366 RepID=A0ABR0DEA5_9LAMI|nr:hypothetical protein RD792_006014 [Penstemon davidsonii]